MPFIQRNTLSVDNVESTDFKEDGHKFEVSLCTSLFFSAYLINIHSFVHTNTCNYLNIHPEKAVQGVATVKQPTAIFLSCLLDHFYDPL